MNCVLEMMNTMRRGKFNYVAAIKQINLFMPEELKDIYKYGIEQCKDSGKS